MNLSFDSLNYTRYEGLPEIMEDLVRSVEHRQRVLHFLCDEPEGRGRLPRHARTSNILGSSYLAR